MVEENILPAGDGPRAHQKLCDVLHAVPTCHEVGVSSVVSSLARLTYFHSCFLGKILILNVDLELFYQS